ncbi:MAG: diphthine synthase [Candidatus Micrarchaeaceae archaeon]
MLYLVGMGISGELSPNAKRICSSSEAYIDSYTSLLSKESLLEVSREIGVEPKPLARYDLEEGASLLAKKAVSSDVAVLVPGDPLVATTHKTLLAEAKKAGAKWLVVHSSSIASAAIGESMLDFYRFGRIATVPSWSEHYHPVSFYETVLGNSTAGAHTLLLFDYDSKKSRSMSFKEAFEVMHAAEKKYQKGILNENSKVIFLHNIGIEGQSVVKGRLSDAQNIKYTDGLNSIIVPAELTYIEAELTGLLLEGEW